jgi:hypothetical protein
VEPEVGLIPEDGKLVTPVGQLVAFLALDLTGKWSMKLHAFGRVGISVDLKNGVFFTHAM